MLWGVAFNCVHGAFNAARGAAATSAVRLVAREQSDRTTYDNDIRGPDIFDGALRARDSTATASIRGVRSGYSTALHRGRYRAWNARLGRRQRGRRRGVDRRGP